MLAKVIKKKGSSILRSICIIISAPTNGFGIGLLNQLRRVRFSLGVPFKERIKNVRFIHNVNVTLCFLSIGSNYRFFRRIKKKKEIKKMRNKDNDFYWGFGVGALFIIVMIALV